MPRIAKPRSPQTEQASRELAAYLTRSSMSGNALAARLGVSQSTISRFLSGRTKTITEAIRPALDHAGIEIKTRISASPSLIDNPRVRGVFEHAWEGGPESVELFVRLLEAIAPILQSPSQSPLRIPRSPS